MLWRRLQGSSRWRHTDQLIDQWLKERQELLKLYCEAPKLSTIQNRPHPPVLDVIDTQYLKSFFNTLIDYLAVLQMEILEKLYELEIDIWKKHRIRYGLNPRLSERLFKTLNPILDIEAECQTILAENPIPWEKIKTALSRLGELLAERLDLEDALIGAYMVARHATQEKERAS